MDKDMMSFENCILTMNPKQYADSPINQYGMVDFNKDGTRPWGMCYKISNQKFGVLAGKSLNPLIYRGENKEYPDFLPSAKRGCHEKSDYIKKEKFLAVYKETPYYQYGMTYINDFGYHMEIDLEAIAQHYGFKTDYLDITRSRTIAEFFAYTYYDNGKYYPITDFTQYSPCIYTADLHDIYKQSPSSLKLISGQIALRPCRQFAMAISEGFDCKPLFQKELLPQNPNRAREIYERLNTYLFPYGDILGAIADAILMENNIDENTKFEFIMDVNGKIERRFNTANSNTATGNTLDSNIQRELQSNIEKIFQPMLRSTAYRGCARSL